MGSIYRPKYTDRHGTERQSAVWWIQYYSHGRKIRESTDTADFGEAKTILKKREGEATSSRPSIGTERRIKFKDLAELEINDYRKNKFHSIKDLQTRFDKHVLPFFGEIKAITIGPADINRYIVKRQQEKAANGTINRELTSIIRAFSLGVEYRLIPFSPKIDILKENNVRQGFFERAQLDAVIPRLRPHNQNPARFAYITGWRKQEVLTMRWPQVDFKAGNVRLEAGTTKNKEARVFPLTSDLRAILEEQRVKADRLKTRGQIVPWVFFHERPGPLHGKRIGDFRKNWDSACTDAGVPGKIFHDFRRTAVRNLVRAGIPERVAMQMTGHKTRSVFERYNIVSEGDLKDAAARLEAFSDKDTGKVRTK
jgi:integrase